jgi:hypothetical protein
MIQSTTDPTATHVVPCAGPAPGVGGVGWMYLQPVQMSPSPMTFARYLHKQSIGLGAAQIVLGSLCIVFNAVALAVTAGGGLGVDFVGHGFWCGILFIVTGAIGISAGVSKTKCKVVSYMVLCIISATFTIALLTCGILSTVIVGNYIQNCQHYGYSYYYSYYYSLPCSVYSVPMAMEGCMAVCGFIAAILFIWGSVLCCKTKPCCGCVESHDMTISQNYAANNSAQMMMPTMPYQAGLPPVYQPNHTQALWMQPQMVQGTVAAAAAAAGPVSSPHLNQDLGLPPKY